MKTVSVEVFDDGDDDGEETMLLRLTNTQGSTLGDGEAVGTIENADAMSRAWLARFGRTAWEQTLDAVEQRLGSAATRAAVAGRERRAADRAPELGYRRPGAVLRGPNVRGVNSCRLVMLALLPVARITNRPSRSARTSDSWYAFR